MFGKFFKSFLGGETKPETAPTDARVPLAVLLVRLARTDYEYVLEERAQIIEILKERFSLDDVAAELLVEQAERAEAEPHDHVHFTKNIKEMVEFEARASVMEDLWLLALADGRRDNEENNFLRLVCSLLGLSDQESAFARQRALARIKGQ
ncbi:MAG: TerB family tellurite resistance protein [Paracoccaceae bacterium]